jgi:beta-lactamase regulating signal transducer with metallopeptidase domain/type II secretory pathway component GspD/PulD (secretin)
MNTLIEALNASAAHALRFAWPMLWQSSLLIALLFALEPPLRRKVRPAVRYALWLVVLVKLLLPPSLALPTGPGWWLRPARAVPASPRLTSVVVTYGAPERTLIPAAVTPVRVEPPPSHLSSTAWLLLSMVTVSLGLLAWMIARWRRVARDAHQAMAAPVPLGCLLSELPYPVRLRITDHPQSPAVCGLFRPVILLPRSLVEGLSPAQLRAVLLHELLHLRRRDVWVNCAQALLQIVYWWHPLLWLANARIRRLREEAVDDAVMLALKEDAETYAPTLLEVAKLALHRPLASLGLVGILESRNALRQRIERLLDFRPPRKAGVTLGSALAVIAFAAVAVPMGQARAPSEATQSAASLLNTNNLASDGLSSSGMPGERQPLYTRTFRINEITLVEGLHVPLGPVATNGSETIFHALLDHLSQAGVDLDPVRNPGKTYFYSDRSGLLLVRATLKDLDIIERKIAALRIAAGTQPAPGTLPESPSSQVTTNGLVPNRLSNPGLMVEQKVKAHALVQDGKLLYEMGKLDEAEAKLEEAIRIDPQNQAAAYYLNLVKEARQKTTGGLGQWLSTPAPQAQTNLVKRQAIVHLLGNIRLDQVAFDATPLSEVLRFLGDESRKSDPEQRGINFILNQNIDSGTSAAAATLGPDGQPLSPGPAEQFDMGSIAINLKYPITNIRLADVLDAIVKVADRPIKYSIQDYGVVFSARTRQQSTPLYVRTFKVDPRTMLEALLPAKSKVKTSDVQAVTRALRNYFASLGVDLDSTKNPGKALFYNDRQSTLVIRSTMQDLDIIEVAIQVITAAPPQIYIKFKVVGVPQNDAKALGFDWYLGNMLMTNGSTGPEAGSAPSSNHVPTTAKPPGTFPGIPHAATTNEPGANVNLSTSRRRTWDSAPFTFSGILTDPQFREVIKALEQRDGTELVAQMGVTVPSGRQAQCKTTEIHSLVKINEQALTPPGITSTNGDESSLYVTEPMELGVVFDVVPTVLEDGYTIRMPVVGTVFEFLGYEDARTNRVAAYVNGKRKWVTPPQPSVRAQQMVSMGQNVYDGQTLVLGGLISESIGLLKDKVPVLGDVPLLGRLFRSESKNTQKRNLLIFVTPTIIDPAGNRVHSADEKPSAPNGIPAQPPR